MLVKTSELTGAALDWVVAKCNEIPNVHIVNKPDKICVYGKVAGVDFPYQPSTDWAQGGPIIEREKINLSDWAGAWYAKIRRNLASAEGSAPLVAAMRCFVASKLGDTVEIPDELTT